MAAADNLPENDREQPFDPFAENDEGAPFGNEPAQLDLGDDDTRLPWLEGDDDEEEYAGYGTGQVIALVLLGLAALGLLVGGIWWATRDRPDEQLVADGGTITAPSGPYKVKPDNPGGEVVSGTGDTRFAVAEGQSRPVQIDESAPAPRPGFDGVAKPAASASGAPSGTPSPAPSASGAAGADTSGIGVQVGAYSTRDAAEKGWARLAQQSASLSGVRHRILQGQADIGTVYRLQAVANDRAAADALCRNLKAANISCQVKP
ncbi:SPOR domain-containing protein [Novosphingobium album (ex Liu et al. 2023)]|uniref:SPOR domain-containing protein n=1 Tax=Novosphingobium album (ex Liu et al. 2023) TaxID=3031130 RepID=A0ABT5WK01_9SPHN|nr:SPOR domain-containing protein [Novosphingobium album (ex Liu et al. 2023)]MDE8650376.1 SPOR domain-containing protein [Novosphingobium album (ex Liu et al. 2023)]